ncbi:MAG: type IV pilin N-terminal domain-containing protein [Euryarchaeota archaeon]|nr:type IV pilin N-terminal domain-containing protein [Euryarchaeota archaeon]
MNDPKNIFNNSKATSPVIGIMLMVVVTVILAAAVSSYSSGMMTTTTVAPTAVFDVSVQKNAIGDMGPAYPFSYLTIKEVTGDSIKTKDLKIITVDAGGNVTEVLPSSGNTNYYYTYGASTYNRNGTTPYWNGPEYFGTGSEASMAKDFGNYTLKPGIAMTADEYSNYVGTTGMEVMFSEWSSVSSGDIVTIKIMHIPSQKVIFQKDIEVM